MYNQFGTEYQKSVEQKKPNRLYNVFIEIPAMVRAVGNISGKRLLDIGCGAGMHLKNYLAKGAKVQGIDLSQTMINLAKKNYPTVDFKVGSMTELPYHNASFDIVTASLSIHYVSDWKYVYSEVNRVLKKGGLFYYSTISPIFNAREKYDSKNYALAGIGKFFDKRTGKTILLGNPWKEDLVTWEMVPGMMVKTYIRTFRTQLKGLIAAGFELIDFIDCKPIPQARKYDALFYQEYTKIPVFSIYVARKK